MNVDFHLLLW